MKIPSDRSAIVTDGIDWSMPAWVRPATFSGLFSESAAPEDHIAVRSVDVSWRQIAPEPDAPLDLTSPGQAQGMSFDPLRDQLAEPGPYWVRLFASGKDWAPTWVLDTCGVDAIGTDYDDQEHLPIWDDCVWSHLRDAWQRLLVDEGILADPNFQFAYVPGGFTWSEFDYEMITSAVEAGELTEDDYLAWYHRMINDLVAIGGDRAGRLVFTGEDYPWGPFDGAEDLLAADATGAGLGIRDGITELSNFHLSEAPAYGSKILPDGHMEVADEVAPHLRADPGTETVVATENECYVACGFSSKDPSYLVVMSNLKALQLRMNWVYAVPGDSLMDPLAEHWDWLRLSLGQRPETSPDAWAALRDAEDRFWRDEEGPFGPGGRRWAGKPFVRNYERWLTQLDVPGAVARRSKVDVHRGDPEPENGIAYEGLSTDVARGNRALAFRLDERFLPPGRHSVVVNVTYWDDGEGGFRIRHSGGRTPLVRFGGTEKWRTASFKVRLPVGQRLPGRTDFWIEKTGPGDASYSFVRVVRRSAP